MAALEDDFESWLSLKLQELNTDESVFSGYIIGILEGDETVEEKTEALEGILTEITESDIPVHCREILEHWKASQINKASNVVSTPAVLENVEEKLAKLMESNVQTTTVQRNYTEEERRIREAILAQYSQTSDQESGDDEEGGGGGEGKENGLFKNTNAASVHQAEREKRERAKIESQKKKEKDKEDREKQKQQQQEKKEKRKTQKGERRR